MKCLSVIFFLTTVFCLTTISSFAQNTTYIDADYKPATAANYTYKRVIKYVKPIINPNIGTGYYGGITSNPQPTGLHVCSLMDYYKTGEPALIVNVLTLDLKCSEWAFDGMAVFYYKNGNIKRKEPYNAGKLQGVVISYDENGNETKRQEYNNGKLIEESKFSAPADSPIIGTWKYVECYQNDCREKDYGYFKSPATIVRTSTYIYSPNGVVESIHELSYQTQKIKGNWKYTPKTASSGVLEEFLGEDLVERANIRFLSRNQLEFTITFSHNPDAVGNQQIWTRQ